MDLIDWSRAQFALTAMYHWLFVPLTLGLALIMGIMESLFVVTGNVFWRQTAKFWMKLFGINFAIGVATGLILEFQFGTNWSNYSWFVGDIFGAPLAIEGILAFFLEATFIAVMFFGWNKVSKGFHLFATWLTGLGATLSAWWILVANAWMQHPIGSEFNAMSMRNELVSVSSFFDVAFSDVAIIKFIHAVLSGWVLGALFVVSICCWYLIRKRHLQFSLKSIKIASIVGLISSFLMIFTGDRSAYLVAKYQPMKLAAMEALYQGSRDQSLVIWGVVNDDKELNDGEPALKYDLQLPYMLSLLATRSVHGYVPGINNILEGDYVLANGDSALSADVMIRRGVAARDYLELYRNAVKSGDSAYAASLLTELRPVLPYLGYSFLKAPEELVPNIPLNFYAFRVMVATGLYFIVCFLFILLVLHYNKLTHWVWLQWLGFLSLFLGYVSGQAGWIVSEVGRQPWTIEGMMPVNVSISSITIESVEFTFWMFAVIFFVLFLAEVGIMVREIVHGPEVVLDVKQTGGLENE